MPQNKPAQRHVQDGPPSIPALILLLTSLLLSGCGPAKQESSPQRYDAAKALFEQTTKEFHIPAAEAKGAEKLKLLEQAAASYATLLKKYPEQDYWAAQALRGLGNVRAAQAHLDEAIQHYAAVDKKYSQHDFEVLMAWKAAADLLWEAGRREEAKTFYRKVVVRFDKPESSQVVKAVLRGSRTRLADGDLPGEK
jgi:tetratricopeptide (TPR) repeat protein